MQVWDAIEAQRKGIVLEHGKDVVSEVAGNVREPALFELARLDYNSDAFQSAAAKSLKPTDGSDWSQKQKAKFHADIFRFRRDIRAVAAAMDMPIKTCHAYYLGTYKSTCEYRLLKTVCIDEREGKAASAEHGPDACSICGDGGSLLICDGCEGEYHMNCLRPPLRVVPEGLWLCDDCVDRRLLASRDLILRRSKLFEKVGAIQSSKRDLDAMQDANRSTNESDVVEASDISGNEILRPVAPVLHAVRKFSSMISKVLSKMGEE